MTIILIISRLYLCHLTNQYLVVLHLIINNRTELLIGEAYNLSHAFFKEMNKIILQVEGINLMIACLMYITPQILKGNLNY